MAEDTVADDDRLKPIYRSFACSGPAVKVIVRPLNLSPEYADHACEAETGRTEAVSNTN
jgi:ABC-type hemin transport system ATPase subunit